mgnify:CR=1 FL=1
MASDSLESEDYWVAYYCFTRHGLKPSEYAELPKREKFLIRYFIELEAEQKKKAERKGGG